MLKLSIRLRPMLSMCLLGCALFLVDCASSNPTSVSSPVSTPAPSSIATPTVLVQPTLNPGLGGITGKLVSGSVTGRAYIGGDLYLGRLIPGSDPKGQPTVALSNDVDPKTDVHNPDGQFNFTDIKPGNYALVIWNPTNSFVVEFPNGGGMIQVKVEPDKVTDLGTIVIP